MHVHTSLDVYEPKYIRACPCAHTHETCSIMVCSHWPVIPIQSCLNLDGINRVMLV